MFKHMQNAESGDDRFANRAKNMEGTLKDAVTQAGLDPGELLFRWQVRASGIMDIRISLASMSKVQFKSVKSFLLALGGPMQAPREEPTPPPNLCDFGDERIDSMLARMEPRHLLTLATFPEQALTVDVPTLVWFNSDYPRNTTVSGPRRIFCRGRWQDGGANFAAKAIRHIASHYRKVIERATHLANAPGLLTSVRLMEVKEYVSVACNGADAVIAPGCPFSATDGVISFQRMCDALEQTVLSNLECSVHDWTDTMTYCDEVLVGV
jgi:hypothetical protein